LKVAVTGASGTIGRALGKAFEGRGDEVVALSRNPQADVDKLRDADAVVHLAGEPVDQRWTDEAKRKIGDSRELGTRKLVEAIAAAGPRLKTLVSASAAGYYGAHGEERVTESEPPADDFLARVVVAWEREAKAAEAHGVRVAIMRTGIVLSPDGGALGRMLPPFKLGVGGPIAGGRQYMPWIHVDDVVGAYLKALDDESMTDAYNLSAPEPVTNKEFSKALGKVLHRPAVAPVPKFAVKLLFGEMSEIVTTGARMVPARLTEAGYEFRRPDVGAALEAAVG
jgi:uncharacterized protein (TIGR01777 family)